MLLTPQLELFPPKPSSTLYMDRCQFNYKTFDVGPIVMREKGVQIYGISGVSNNYLNS